MRSRREEGRGLLARSWSQVRGRLTETAAPFVDYRMQLPSTSGLHAALKKASQHSVTVRQPLHSNHAHGLISAQARRFLLTVITHMDP